MADHRSRPKLRINRRRFIGQSAALLAGTGLASQSSHATPPGEMKREPGKIQEYRTLGRTGFKVSDISFGAGSLTNANLLKEALDLGINYIDTAEHYVNGQSERTIGEVLKQRNRKEIFLTTKINLSFRGSQNTKEGIKQRFTRCLERLQTPYVDCLMIHMAQNEEQLRLPEFHSAAEELKSEGKVRFLGLSNHGTEFSMFGRLQVPMERVVCAAVADGRFDVALFVYNFLQKKQGEAILAACKEKHVGVTLMKVNPVSTLLEAEQMFDERKKSGAQISEAYIKVFEEYKQWVSRAEAFKNEYNLKSDREIRDAALKFVLQHPDVHSACITIKTFEDLAQFVRLSGQKLQSTDQGMLEEYEQQLGRYYCRHACGICEFSCPQAVPVNTIMRYHHYFATQGREKYSMEQYANLANANAERCTGCSGPCEQACPYGVPIRELLVLAHNTLTIANHKPEVFL